MNWQEVNERKMNGMERDEIWYNEKCKDMDRNWTTELNQRILTIKANSSDKELNRNFIHKGIAKRAFTKQFRLAENVEVKDAEFADGILSVNLTKLIPEEEKPKQIKIKTSNYDRKIIN